MHFGKALKIAMIKKGVNAEEIARRNGVSTKAIHNLNKVKSVHLRTAKRYADSLGIPLHEFLKEAEDLE